MVPFVADEGLKAHASASILDNHQHHNEDDDPLCDDMSRMSIAFDDDTLGFRSTNARSVRFDQQSKSPSPPLSRVQTCLPHIMGVWKDIQLRKRISLQIQMLSGSEAMKMVCWRVSTDQKYFIVSITMDKGFTTPEAAFHHHILSKCKNPSEYKLTEQILNHHSKTQAWREAISKLKGRDPNKSTIIEDIRIPLPFKVQHRYPTKSDDPFFHGIKHLQHTDGTSWLHVELFAEFKDSYSPLKGTVSTGSVASTLKSPPVVVGGPLPPLDDEDDDDKDDEDYTYTSVPDSKLFADSDAMSLSTIGTGQWAEKHLSPTSARCNKNSKSTYLSLRTSSGICTVAEGALSPIRKTKRQKIANQTTGKKRTASKNVSSNGTVG